MCQFQVYSIVTLFFFRFVQGLRKMNLLFHGRSTFHLGAPLAWKVPWTGEPGGLQSMGSRRVGPNRATSLSIFTFMHWRRKWQPTPVFLPGESQGWGSRVGCHLWGRTESDTTDVTQQHVIMKHMQDTRSRTPVLMLRVSSSTHTSTMEHIQDY